MPRGNNYRRLIEANIRDFREIPQQLFDELALEDRQEFIDLSEELIARREGMEQGFRRVYFVMMEKYRQFKNEVNRFKRSMGRGHSIYLNVDTNTFENDFSAFVALQYLNEMGVLVDLKVVTDDDLLFEAYEAESLASRKPVNFIVHFQDYADVPSVDGQIVGDKRIEGLQITELPYKQGVECYLNGHVQNLSDVNQNQSGYVGTRGCKLRLEGFSITLIGENSMNYDVEYRVHSQTEWSPWISTGYYAGTRGESKPINGIEIFMKMKPEFLQNYQDSKESKVS